MTIKLTRTRLALVAAAIVTGIAGVSYAAVPAANGTISACKDAKGGLKVIDAEAGQTCNANQHLLTWNQQGPAGPQGAPGISGYELVFAQQPASDSDTKSQFVACPQGKSPIGGGGSIRDDTGALSNVATLTRVQPLASGYNVAAVEREGVTVTWSLFASAICATVG
jgi:hypothetical protein